MTSKDGTVTEYLRYLNTIFQYPITYKLKGSSNNDEFFLYYVTDIDTVLQEPTAGDGVKMGQTRGAYDISFTIRCEFNTIGYFTLNAPEIQSTIQLPDDGDEAIVSMFSDVINLDNFDLPEGWSILGWPIFKLDHDENCISLDPILNESLLSTIDYHLKFHIPMERFIRIQFRENGEILNSERFYINWRERKLYVVRPDTRRTYRLIVSVCGEYINNLIKEIYKLE